ncbi:dioxygenase family protein [Rhizobium sp. C4]|uniref:dioxygenase family protein n=1 Tax=Rhizobium sp. C4 TaxID=1349800 RepID=UPI001E47DD60|nr:dioxygenase [Rhizobium sp. C4]MCD2172513.1 6-chlorohydroxyquinol-1,2-dioxygenase [Rhizobium sp. C4]
MTMTIDAASGRAISSLDRLDSRFGDRAGEALPSTLIAFAAHLHALVRELQPSREEWRGFIALLKDIGEYSHDRRDEWMLISDLLGISALVEEMNACRPAGATPNTPRGPFFRADAPMLPLGSDICLDGKGEPLTVRGRVLDLHGKPVAGAEIITWQANAQGFYENQQPDDQPEFNLRGRFVTDEAGHFQYRTIMPSGYPVPLDGPAGELMKRAGLPSRRPAHLQFHVSADGFETITTHIFDADDPHLANDPLFAVKPELVKSFTHGEGQCELDCTFVMVRTLEEISR